MAAKLHSLTTFESSLLRHQDASIRASGPWVDAGTGPPVRVVLRFSVITFVVDLQVLCPDPCTYRRDAGAPKHQSKDFASAWAAFERECRISLGIGGP